MIILASQAFLVRAPLETDRPDAYVRDSQFRQNLHARRNMNRPVAIRPFPEPPSSATHSRGSAILDRTREAYRSHRCRAALKSALSPASSACHEIAATLPPDQV